MCRMKTITPPYQTDIHSAGELKQQLIRVWSAAVFIRKLSTLLLTCRRL